MYLQYIFLPSYSRQHIGQNRAGSWHLCSSATTLQALSLSCKCLVFCSTENHRGWCRERRARYSAAAGKGNNGLSFLKINRSTDPLIFSIRILIIYEYYTVLLLCVLSMERRRQEGDRNGWESVEELGIGGEAEKALAESIRAKVWWMPSGDAKKSTVRDTRQHI